MKKLMIPLMISIAFLVGCETAEVPVKTTSIEKIIMTDKAAEETFDLSMKWLNETFVLQKVSSSITIRLLAWLQARQS